jgi:hypothetical protein
MMKLPESHLELYPLGDDTERAIESSYGNEFILNERYTREERVELAVMFQTTVAVKKYDHLSTELLAEYDYWLSPGTITFEGFAMLLEPLENMPLYVNDEKMDKQTIAIWRLKCAK